MTSRGRRVRKPKGVSQKQIDKVLAGPKTRAGIEAKAKRVQTYWQSIAPVFDPDDPREHRKHPAHGDPGDYRDSIKYTVAKVDGQWQARVVATDFKAKWIEYGTKHMPKMAPLAKVIAKFRLGR